MTDQVRGVTDAVVEFISCGRVLKDVVAVPDPEGRFELHVRFDSR